MTILTVACRLNEATLRDGAEGLRADFARAGPANRRRPGLIWKISAIDGRAGRRPGDLPLTSPEAARAFAEGALIAGLRGRAGISDVTITAAPVERGLSLAMGAAAALGVGEATPAAPAAA